MNPSIASLICACGIAGLFYLNRDNTVHTSKALWLPVVWIWLVGSRPVSGWLGISPTGANVQLDGSPVDAAVFGVLLASAIVVLISRGKRVRTLVNSSWPILVYFLYCLISVTWSFHAEVSFKRWSKAIGDLAMALVIATDGQPIAALRRLNSRVGFLLFPTSVLLIKYYGDLGRGYTPDGAPMNTGVTTNKNSLGLIVFLVSLGALWNVRALLIDREAPNRTRRLIAEVILLTFGIVLLGMAHCATAVTCFVLGGGLMLLTTRRAIRNRPGRVYALCLVIVLGGALAMLFGGGSVLSESLGRGNGLSGRTEIWTAVVGAAGNPVIGTGFESFWISPNVQKVWSSLSGWWDPKALNEAHNGYIEVYLNLGWIGLFLITLVLISGYRRTIKAFQFDPELASLMLAYVATGTFYSMTEAGFRMMSPSWIFLLLAVVSSSRVVCVSYGREASKILASRGGTMGRTPASNQPIPEREAVYSARRGVSQFEITRAKRWVRRSHSLSRHVDKKN
jgi:exopolysaccharide production protein ExoQ